MALTTDILATYRSPQAVMRRHLAMGVREDRAIFYLILVCGLVFVAQWPRQAYPDDSVPLDVLLGGAMMGWLFLVPLALCLIAGLPYLAAKAFSGHGSWFTARLAMFWPLLATNPLWMLNGLVAGFIGPGVAFDLTSLIDLAIFLSFWGLSPVEAEWPVVHV